MDNGLQTELIGADGELVLAVRGEVDMATAPQLERACRELATRTDRLVLDFAGVTFLDSSGIKVLADARQWAATATITIRNASNGIRRVMQITGVDDLLGEQRPAAADRP